jgi:hypothetical protein
VVRQLASPKEAKGTLGAGNLLQLVRHPITRGLAALRRKQNNMCVWRRGP